ncbi:MAG: galactitol-1-phosphate 5-dehydrogenase [Chloroflexota bacterium]
MKALVFVGPGEMTVMERPDRHPGRGEVLIGVRASGICGSDVHGYLGLTGRRQPGVVMGHEAAGDVLEIGPDVTGVAMGDRVVLRSILPCGHCEPCVRGQSNVCENRRGLGMQFDGAYAERMVVPATLAVRLPDASPFVRAALVEPLAVALHAVAITRPEPGDDVVIVGSGPIGLLTLLAVRLRGVRSVAITDRHPHRLAVARALGADLAVDVGVSDPVEAVHAATNGRGADVVFEAVGISATVAQSLAVVRTGGRVTWIGNAAPTVELPMQDLVTRELTLRGSYAFAGEFDEAIDLLATGRIDVRPLIELTASLDDAPDIFRRLGEGTLDAIKVVLVPNGR